MCLPCLCSTLRVGKSTLFPTTAMTQVHNDNISRDAAHILSASTTLLCTNSGGICIFKQEERMLKSAQIQNKVISNLWYFDIIIIHGFYTPLFSALEHSLCMSQVILKESLYPFTARINIHGSALWLSHGWCHMKCCHLGASSVYTIQPCTSLQCHFIQSHIGRVYVCSAVTCHLYFWQNDWDLLRATAVTRVWNRSWNKSQHRNDPGEENPPAVPARTRAGDLLITKLSNDLNCVKFN